MRRRLQLAASLTLLAVSILVGASCDWSGTQPGFDADANPTDVPDGSDLPDTFEERSVGATCSAPGQCVDGATCIGNPFGSYACMRHCDDVWTLCSDGSVCTPVANGPPICYTGGAARRGEPCQSNLHCQTGLLCVGATDQQYYCLEACHTSEGGCDTDAFCNPFGDAGKGYCRSKVGAACATNADCRDRLRCTSDIDTTLDSQFPSGYCTKSPCSSDDDCPGDAICRTYPNTDHAMCFSPCDFDAECRIGANYTCLTRSTCRQTANPQACNAFRDDAQFCVPPPLRTWSDG